MRYPEKFRRDVLEALEPDVERAKLIYISNLLSTGSTELGDHLVCNNVTITVDPMQFVGQPGVAEELMSSLMARCERELWKMALYCEWEHLTKK